MLAILSILLTTLPLAQLEPICQDPPPIAAFIPNLTKCQALAAAIFAISKLQDDEPILWSQHPSPSVRNRQLPYRFQDPLASNDCEFIVDALREGKHDTFPTRLIGEAAEAIVEKCMERGVEGAETVGAVAVGPKRVIVVVLARKGRQRVSGGGELTGLDMTNATLQRAGSVSSVLPSLVEAV